MKQLKDQNGLWFVMGTSYRHQVGKVHFHVVSHFGGKMPIEERLGDLMVNELAEKTDEEILETDN